MKGNEMHGTVPAGPGSCGLVLISKRNTLRRFDRGGYTDRTNVAPGARARRSRSAQRARG